MEMEIKIKIDKDEDYFHLKKISYAPELYQGLINAMELIQERLTYESQDMTDEERFFIQDLYEQMESYVDW